MPEIGRRESGGGRRREDWGLPGLKMHVKSEARKSDGKNGEIRRYGRPMMSGEFITSFTMVSAEFDTTAMRAFRYNGRISEYIYGTASLALCGRSDILCRLGS